MMASCSIAFSLLLSSGCVAVAGALDDKGLICSLIGDVGVERPHGWYFSEGLVTRYEVLGSLTKPELGRKHHGPYEEMLGTVFFGKDASGGPAYLLDLKKMVLGESASELGYICEIKKSLRAIQRTLMENLDDEEGSSN